MKELDRIKIIEHFNFELFLEGNDIGWNYENCLSLGWFFFFAHIVRERVARVR
jgi:hypothetical protein